MSIAGERIPELMGGRRWPQEGDRAAAAEFAALGERRDLMSFLAGDLCQSMARFMKMVN